MRTVVAMAAAFLMAGPAAFGSSEHLGKKAGTPAKIVDFDFAPRDLTINAGETITWTNDGARPHTVTDRGGTFDTNPVAPRRSESVTFSVPGKYAYFCRINPGRMNGTITVNATGPTKTTRIQALDPGRPNETLRFDPASLEIDTGTTIVFANVGGKPHTLTADDGSFDTGVAAPGAEGGKFAGSNATITLREPGTFAFHCEVHAVMKGVLTVKGEAKEAPAAASGAATRTEIEIQDFAFKPAEVSVAPGGEVVWRNAGAVPHTATFDDVQLDTNVIQKGTEATLTAPDKPGSYSYKCNIHPARMRAVLVVVGQNVADPTQAGAAAPAAATGGGPGTGVSGLALATGVIGAFLGGFGISAFVRGSPPAG